MVQTVGLIMDADVGYSTFDCTSKPVLPRWCWWVVYDVHFGPRALIRRLDLSGPVRHLSEPNQKQSRLSEIFLK